MFYPELPVAGQHLTGVATQVELQRSPSVNLLIDVTFKKDSSADTKIGQTSKVRPVKSRHHSHACANKFRSFRSSQLANVVCNRNVTVSYTPNLRVNVSRAKLRVI